MSIDQERAWAESVNKDGTVLQAPHHGQDTDQELADLEMDIQPASTEEGSSAEEDHPVSQVIVQGNNPEGEDSDWDIDVTSDEYENINKRAQNRNLKVKFKVLKPGQKHIGVTDTREKAQAKRKEKGKEKQSNSDEDEDEEEDEDEDEEEDEDEDEDNVDEHPWEARLWVNNVKLGNREKNGMQMFFGNYKTEKQAQDVHDMAAIFFKKSGARGKEYTLNFPASEQEQHMADFAGWLVRDFTWYHRRHSDSFCRSKVGLKGVTQVSSRGKEWFEAKISYTIFKKHEWPLGKFDTKEEAGRAYDLALLYCHRYEGAAKMIQHVITNYRPSQYTTAEIREAGRKLDPKPQPRWKVREAQSQMNKKRRSV